MAKFNRGSTRPLATSPVKTTEKTSTHQGGPGFSRDNKSDLYLLAVTNMVSENTFYESGEKRDNRFTSLTRTVALEDPKWVQGFFPWLRTEGFMRSASLVGAAETAKALCDEHRYDGVEDMIDGVLKRADEPGEFLAYWRSIAGRSQPKRYRVVQRGVARAVVRLYTERNWLKWDSPKAAYRFGDVLSITAPRGSLGAEALGETQSDLFKYMLDSQHNREGVTLPESLSTLRKHIEWRTEVRRLVSGNHASSKEEVITRLLDPKILRDAALTWEDVMSALGSVVEKRDLWQSIIPSMGVMALCRNLRNFDEAEVIEEAAQVVINKITDTDQITRSKMFPFRFLAAHNAVGSLRWSHALEKALTASLVNVPELKGNTLILVDRSGSMFGGLSERTQLNRADSAAIFGTALAMRAQKATLVQYGTGSQKVAFRKGDSLLRMVERFGPMGGTDTAGAARSHFAGHDRVVIITDEQTGYYGWSQEDVGEVIPKSVPLYTWNLAGYQTAHAESGVKNRHTFGGLSDASFRLISLLESHRNAQWPWM